MLVEPLVPDCITRERFTSALAGRRASLGVGADG
jgi:hypothetical protein